MRDSSMRPCDSRTSTRACARAVAPREMPRKARASRSEDDLSVAVKTLRCAAASSGSSPAIASCVSPQSRSTVPCVIAPGLPAFARLALARSMRQISAAPALGRYWMRAFSISQLLGSALPSRSGRSASLALTRSAVTLGNSAAAAASVSATSSAWIMGSGRRRSEMSRIARSRPRSAFAFARACALRRSGSIMAFSASVRAMPTIATRPTTWNAVLRQFFFILVAEMKTAPPGGGAAFRVRLRLRVY